MASSGLTAQAVADLVGGRLLGNGSVLIRSVAPLDRAGPADLSLLVSVAYRLELQDSRAAAVLVTDELAAEVAAVCTAIVVKDPGARLEPGGDADCIPAPVPVPGVDVTARVGAGAVLGEGVSVGPHVVHRGARHAGRALPARCRRRAGG